jgi:hypothetical protein
MSQHTPEGERLSSYLLDTTLALGVLSYPIHDKFYTKGGPWMES